MLRHESGQQNAVVVLLLPDLPFFEKTIGEIVQVFIIQGRENRNDDLIGGLLFELLQVAFEVRGIGRGKNARIIIDPAAGPIRHGKRERARGNNQHPQAEKPRDAKHESSELHLGSCLRLRIGLEIGPRMETE